MLQCAAASNLTLLTCQVLLLRRNTTFSIVPLCGCFCYAIFTGAYSASIQPYFLATRAAVLEDSTS